MVDTKETEDDFVGYIDEIQNNYSFRKRKIDKFTDEFVAQRYSRTSDYSGFVRIQFPPPISNSNSSLCEGPIAFFLALIIMFAAFFGFAYMLKIFSWFFSWIGF